MIEVPIYSRFFIYFLKKKIIVHEETARWKCRGFDDGSIAGMVISAPTVMNFGSAELRQKVCYSLLPSNNKKLIQLFFFRLFLTLLLVERESVLLLLKHLLVPMLLALRPLLSRQPMVSTTL